MFSFRKGAGLIALVCINSAFAGDLTVVNPSFEIGTPMHSENPDGNYYDGLIDGPSFAGWNTTGDAGYWAPVLQPTRDTFDAIPDGTQVGFTGNGVHGGSLYQDLTHAITAGETYTLSVYLGNRADLPVYNTSPYGSIALADDNGTILREADSLTAATGTFELKTLSYTVPANSASIGRNLRVILSSGASQQMSFDIVKVNAVPEPAPVAALGLGLAALTRRRRR